jgi:hypothetical protein
MAVPLPFLRIGKRTLEDDVDGGLGMSMSASSCQPCSGSNSGLTSLSARGSFFFNFLLLSAPLLSIVFLLPLAGVLLGIGGAGRLGLHCENMPYLPIVPELGLSGLGAA